MNDEGTSMRYKAADAVKLILHVLSHQKWRDKTRHSDIPFLLAL